MRRNKRAKSLLERKMEDPKYRERFDRGYPAFELEVQILKALEKKHWSYSDLAKVLHTNKSNISRDLSAGKIRSATIARVAKIAEALGYKFLPVFVSEKHEKTILSKIQKAMAV